MATYTVGEQGATVFDDRGRLLMYLRPGAVVVPGTTGETLAERTPDQESPTRRQPGPCTPGYADKVIRPERTSPTPPRQPDARLRNPLAGSG